MRYSKLGNFANNHDIIFIVIIFCVAVFSKFYNLETRFSFGWDQARDAQALWSILVNHKLTLIGPQVVSDDAFFLGPFWYYFLLPFYLLFHMDPFGEAVAAAFIGILTSISLYFFTKKSFGLEVAAISSLIWASSPSTLAWNPMLVPIFEILILFSLFKIQEGKTKFIPLSSLLLGLSLQIHVQMAFFILLLITSIISYQYKEKLFPIRDILMGVFLFTLTFLPLIFFDLKHNFLNIKGFLKIFGIGTTNIHNNLSYTNQLIITMPKFISTANFLPDQIQISPLVSGTVVILFSIIGFLLIKISIPKKIIFLSLIILPTLIFSFYKGTLSEYYFTLSALPILIGSSIFLIKLSKLNLVFKILVYLLVSLIVYSNISKTLFTQNQTSLYYQKQAISYLTQQKSDQLINLSYDVPINQDSSFKYLSKLFALKIEDIPEAHLWTIVIPAPQDTTTLQAKFGDIGIIRR